MVCFCLVSSQSALPVTVDAKLQVQMGEPKTTHPWFGRAAVGPRFCDGITHAPVGQPAGVTAVEPRQPPGSVELAHFGDPTAVNGTRLDRFGEVELARVLQEVHSS